MKYLKDKIDAAARDEGRVFKSEGILYISSGLPGAGKSTWLKDHIRSDEVIVSRDEIRFSILKDGEKYFSHEEEVFNTFAQRIVENLKSHKNVYADATHLTPISQLKLLAPILLDVAPASIQYIYFNIPIDICLEHNEYRKGTKTYVPQEVVRRMKETSEFRPCIYIDKAWEVGVDGLVSKWR